MEHAQRPPFKASPLARRLARWCAAARRPAASVSLAALSAVGWAAPKGGAVVAGEASIAQRGGATTVTQASPRAAIDWRSFNVGATESVRFVQPSVQASVLNRVTGPDASAIFGRISANGQVFLVNRNGILFGRGAQVDVGSLVASTNDIATPDFMAGRLRFTTPGAALARVDNEGTLTIAEGGFAALIGRRLGNSGVIEARLGKVALAAGDAFVLDLRGDQLVNIVVDPAALASVKDTEGLPLSARVDNQGRITADGGRVQLSAATVQQLVDNVINVQGVVRATSFESEPGRISLRGDSRTRLAVGGQLDASATSGAGGRIEATAGAVDLAPSALLDASGQAGGGVVLAGGGWQGRGALPNARQVHIAAGAQIDVSARQSGHGGTAVVWSDGETRFAGRIDAHGGPLGGNGGAVEVSAAGRLGFDGDVSAAAPRGRAGTLLLDPANLVLDGVRGAGTLPGAQAAGDFTVDVSSVNRPLRNGTGVVLKASQDIALNANAVIDARGGSSGAALTLDAGRNISLGGAVILADGAFTATAGGSFSQAAGKGLATGSGAIDIRAVAGIDAAGLLTSGDVALSSAAGNVRLQGPVAGAPGIAELGPASAAARSLLIRTGGEATLGGAALGAGGLTIEGAQAGQRAGSAVLATASVFSAGPVSVRTEGALGLEGPAGIDTPSSVTLDSAAGPLRTGDGLIRAGGRVTLASGGTLGIGIAGAGSAGGIQAGGDLELRAGDDLVAQGALQTAGGTLSAASSRGSVTLADVSTWQPGVEPSGVLAIDAARDVTLTRALGGPDTGYTQRSFGYQPALRPAVGRVAIAAGRDVEVNGLNLDGNTSAGDAAKGLSIQAGHRLVSNALIAVNKGDIALSATGTDPTDGIYLGHSVYSRGLDRDGTPAGKTGYAITLGGSGAPGARGNLFLFDNTADSAQVAADEGGTVEIAKIVVANNVANYKTAAGDDDPVLVPASGTPPVSIAADALQGLDAAPGPLRLATLPGASSIVPLDRGRTLRSDGSAGSGVSLKVQVFRSGTDAATTVAEVTVDATDDNGDPVGCQRSQTYEACGVKPVIGNTIKFDGTLTGARTAHPFDEKEVIGGSGDAGDVIGYALGEPGTAAAAALVLPSAFGAQAATAITQGKEDNPFTGSVDYRIRNRIVALPSSVAATQVLIFRGTIETASARAFFNNSGQLNQAKGDTLSAARGTVGTPANSNPGFAAIGGFGRQQGIGVAQLPPVLALRPLIDDSSASSSAGRLGPDSAEVAPSLVSNGDLALGTRAAAEADLGRGSAAGGSAPNVFRKRYRLARSSDETVCAPSDIETQPADAKSAQERACPAK